MGFIVLFEKYGGVDDGDEGILNCTLVVVKFQLRRGRIVCLLIEPIKF